MRRGRSMTASSSCVRGTLRRVVSFNLSGPWVGLPGHRRDNLHRVDAPCDARHQHNKPVHHRATDCPLLLLLFVLLLLLVSFLLLLLVHSRDTDEQVRGDDDDDDATAAILTGDEKWRENRQRPENADSFPLATRSSIDRELDRRPTSTTVFSAAR